MTAFRAPSHQTQCLEQSARGGLRVGVVGWNRLGNTASPTQTCTQSSGGSISVDGDFDVYALQLEYALGERFSLVAGKDGYIDFNPDGDVLSDDEGFANIAAGLKYAFLYQPENQFVLSGIASVEFPSGDSEVWQGSGDGALNLILSQLKLYDRWQVASALGAHLPFDSDAESTTGFMSAHLSYDVSRWFRPLVKVNWYHVFDEGDGNRRFNSQAGGNVPSLVAFEGGDLINFGASNAGMNEDVVTLGLGFRSQLAENVSLGFAYEFPLTDKEENLMDERFTLDLVWRF